jgi:hypothetical protein
MISGATNLIPSQRVDIYEKNLYLNWEMSILNFSCFFFFSLSLLPIKNYIAWQAFEPPLDMSQEADIFEDSHLENSPNVCTCQSTSTSGSLCFSKYDQACSGEGSNAICKSPDRAHTNEVFLAFI